MVWLECYDDVLKVEITKEQACFLEEYISNMLGGDWNEEETSYKKDFILKKEHEDMIQELHKVFYEELCKWVSSQGELDVSAGSETYETSISIIKEDDKFFIELEVSCDVDCDDYDDEDDDEDDEDAEDDDEDFR